MKLIGTELGEPLTGGSAPDTIKGLGGNDILTGNGGNDVIQGGDGVDILYGDENSSLRSQVAGNDTLDGGAGSDIIIAGFGNDTLNGGDGNDYLIGGGGYGGTVVNDVPNAFYFIDVDGGKDVYDGGDGVDRAFVVYAQQTGAIVFDNSDPVLRNLIRVDGVNRGSMINVEEMRFHAGSGDDIITGGDAYDDLYGNAGNDTLSGGEGNDFVTGGLGDDYLDGGAGFDMASYFNATSGVTVDMRLQGAAQDTGAGMDTLVGIENLRGSAFADTLIGDDFANTLTGYTGGNDTLIGRGGDDYLYNQRTTAAASTVNMNGGDGDDILYFDRSDLSYRDTVTLTGGTGEDTIYAYGIRTGTINAGADSDLVYADVSGGKLDITLGDGSDTLSLVAYGTTFVAGTSSVRDFAAGDGGDVLEITYYLRMLQNYETGSNPFTDGHMRLVQKGSNVQLKVDVDGGGNGYVPILTFKNVDLTDFTDENFSGFSPLGSSALQGVLAAPSSPAGRPQPVGALEIDGGMEGFAPAALRAPSHDFRGAPTGHGELDAMTAGPVHAMDWMF